MFAAYVPAFFIGTIAGSFIDKTAEKKWLLLLVDFSCTIAVSIVALLSFFFTMNPWILFLSTAVIAIGNSLYTPTVNVMVPSLEAGTQVSKVNAAIALTYRVNQIVGPIIAGIALTSFNHNVFFVVIIATFIISCLIETQIKIKPMNTHKAKSSTHSSILSSAIDGIKWLVKDIKFLRLFLAEVIFTLCVVPMAIIIPAYAQIELNKPATFYTSLLSLIGVGGIIAAIISMLNKNKTNKLSSLIFPLTLMIAGALTMGLSENLYLIQLSFVLFGFGIVRWTVVLRSYLQLNLPVEKMGRYFANVFALSGLMTPLSFLIIGLLLDITGARFMFFLISAGLAIIIGLLILIQKSLRVESFN